MIDLSSCQRRLLLAAGLLLLLALSVRYRQCSLFGPVLVVGMLSRGRDPRREIEQQAAFEEAERVRAERRAAVVFDSFIDSSPVSIEIFGADGTPLRSNKAAERLLGKVPPPGIPLTDERGLRRAGLLQPQLARVLAGTRVETPPTWYDPTEIGLAGIPGRKVCFRATVFPLFDSDGRVVRIAVMYEDLTELMRLKEELKAARATVVPAVAATVASGGEDVRDVEFGRRKLEAALRESEERYRSFVESARGYVIVRFSEDGHILAISPSVEEFWGIRRETIVADSGAFFGRVHPEDIELVKANEARARQTGTYPEGYRFRVVNMTTGAVRWLEARGAASVFAGRRVFDLVLVDVSAAEEAARRLAGAEAKLASIVESSFDGVFVLDKDWVVKAWSKGAEQETRFAAAEVLGKRLWDVYPELERSGMAGPLRKVMLERKPQYFEGFYQDGREKYAGWFAVSSYPYDGGLLAFVRNISARKRAELAWQEAESKLRAVFDQPGLIVALKGRDLRYLAANQAAARAFGAGATLVGRTDPEFFNARVSALLGSRDRAVLENGRGDEFEIALPDGQAPNASWYHFVKQPWRNGAGQVVGVLDIAWDVTARVRLESELARRTAAIEKLVAAGAATLKQAQDELGRWKT